MLDSDVMIEKMKKKGCFDEVNSAPQGNFFFHPRVRLEYKYVPTVAFHFNFPCSGVSHFYKLKSFVAMGRKRTAEELNQIAVDNGFVAGAYEEEDQVSQKRDPYTARYIENQEESLNLWKM